MVVACIPAFAVTNPEAVMLVADIPPFATICFPIGTVTPPFAVINSPANMVVEDTMLFADIAPDAPIVATAIAPDMFAPPTTSRDTEGTELPIPILACPPPVKYMLFVADAFVPY
jgi:hypothetical protein